MHGFIQEIGIAIVASTLIGLLSQKIRQPLILGYFIAGAIIGPEIGLCLVSDPKNIEIISEIGLILLLFVIGLEMDFAKIMNSGTQLLVSGIGQFLLCALMGLTFFSAINIPIAGENLNGLYLSLLCALSSTAIVVKLLYDKLEVDTLAGRITIGILVMQDIWAVLFLAFQPNLQNPEIKLFALALGKGALLLLISYILSKYLLTRIFKWVSSAPELTVLTSLGWCASMAGIASYLGLSQEMGALISGAAISAFPYSVFVSAKVLPLRDFFLTLFFVSLGMKIPTPTMHILNYALLFALFIFVSRFFSIYPLLALTGAGRRTAFLSSLNLAQISEFSLVIAAIGLGYGHITNDTFVLVIYTMVITSISSSYLIKYSHPIYNKFNHVLTKLGRAEKSVHASPEPHHTRHSIVILGFHRGARAVIEDVYQNHSDWLKSMVVIDFNLEILREVHKIGIHGIYGDISHPDTLAHAHLNEAKIILSTIPNMLLKGTKNEDIVRICRSLNPTAYIIATAEHSTQVIELTRLGANEVVLPYTLAGKFVADKITDIMSSV